MLNPELNPSWHVVSEYANGKYGVVLWLMFVSWAVSTWSLAFLLRCEVRAIGGKVGLGFRVIAGVGEALAAALDINHSIMHGLAGVLGPFGSLLTRVGRTKRNA